MSNLNDPENSVEKTEEPSSAPKPIVQPVTEEVKEVAVENNALLEFDWSVPIDEKELNSTTTLFTPLASSTVKETREKIASLPNLSVENNPDAEAWLNVLQNGVYTTPNYNVFYRTANRTDAEYRQVIDSENGKLGFSIPKYKDNNSTIVSGQMAVLRVRAALGLGSISNIPLWHSGFWISFKAPADSAVLELHRRLTEEKIQLGRNTWGLSFANASVFFNNWLIDFALEHMYETTLKLPADQDIRTYISCLDIPTLVWGLASVIWPRGFNYARAVLEQEDGQTKVIREKLNISKLQWTDRRSLTAWQIAHMTNRKGATMTLDSVAKYKDEFILTKGRTVAIKDDVIDFAFKVPNILEYREAGEMWIGSIIDMVDRSLGMQSDEALRNKYINDQGKASYMRQYAHWVESITSTGAMINDRDTINDLLTTLSSETDIRNEYFKQVIKFIEDSTISIIAVPALKDEGLDNNNRFPNLVAIDAMYVFFTLLVQKTVAIQRQDYVASSM
jgi:hypothetical protein